MQNLTYLDPPAIAALLAEETRPRATVIGEGVLIVLRGVNVNEGDDPVDMVSLRAWVDPHRIVSLSMRRVAAVQDLSDLFVSGKGPRTAGGWLGTLADLLNARIEPFVGTVAEQVDRIEEDVFTAPIADAERQAMSEARMSVVSLRRHLSPQRDALAALAKPDHGFIAKVEARRLHEAQDRTARAVEELDLMRERLTVLREEIAGQQSERMNRTMMLLSVISTVFLPLGFLTGLFGVNLAGIPGASHPWGFAALCVGLLVLVGLQLFLLRRLWRN